MTEIPTHYDPRNARAFAYRPDVQALFDAATAFRRDHHLLPAASDLRRNHLVLIDMQRDFCFPEGTLYVGGRSGQGALGDNDRIARFIYQNLSRISEITCTLDSHLPFQIFFAPFWVDRAGAPLAAQDCMITVPSCNMPSATMSWPTSLSSSGSENGLPPARRRR